MSQQNLTAAQINDVRTRLLSAASRAGYRDEARRILDDVLPTPRSAQDAATNYVAGLEQVKGEPFKDGKRTALHAAFLAGVGHATGETPADADEDF